MLLSGCKGNTFFWKSTFFYGLICVQSEKIQKTAWFNQLTDCINEGSETAKTSVFVAKRNRTVMKNISLLSWQDTYYSDNSNANYRGYFEGCDLAEVVDWICDNGDIWFERCNLIHRDRAGNNIVAAGTEVNQQWGSMWWAAQMPSILKSSADRLMPNPACNQIKAAKKR